MRRCEAPTISTWGSQSPGARLGHREGAPLGQLTGDDEGKKIHGRQLERPPPSL